MCDAGDVMREAVAAYQTRESMTAVAQPFEMPPGRLRRGIVTAGVAMRGTGVIPFDCDELRRLYISEELDAAEIAQRFGVPTWVALMGTAPDRPQSFPLKQRSTTPRRPRCGCGRGALRW